MVLFDNMNVTFISSYVVYCHNLLTKIHKASNVGQLQTVRADSPDVRGVVLTTLENKILCVCVVNKKY